MAYSGDVVTGDQATAAQYNALRDDIDNFVELIGTEAHATTTDNWEDWDISGIVPAGTKYVLVLMFILDNAARTFGARKNGSGLERKITVNMGLGLVEAMVWPTECDSNRVIEIIDASATNPVDFGILGYWSGIGL